MSYLNYEYPKKKKSKKLRETFDNFSINENNMTLANYSVLNDSSNNKNKKNKEPINVTKYKQYLEQNNITDISKKYLDFDSTYRNRNLYSNPCDYSVPVYSANTNTFTSYYQSFIDLIDDATPISNSLKPANMNVTGVSVTASRIQLDLSESDIPNFYINTTIEIDGDFRNVIAYDNVTKVVTVDEPFVAIPQAGRPYTFRKFSNFYTATVVPISLSYPNGQTTPVVNTLTGDVSVSQLSILSSNILITKELYLNSILRFLNGPHQEQTTSVVSFEQIIPDDGWLQPYYGSSSFSSDMELLSYYDSKGISFPYTGTNYFYLESINLCVYSSQTTRTILIELLTGDINNVDTINYYRTSQQITVTPYTQQIITVTFKTPILIKPQRIENSVFYNADTVNIFIQDITDGGNAYGYLNLVSSPPVNNSIQYFGFQSMPYLVLNGYTQSAIYQSIAYGNNSFISTSNEQGISIYNTGKTLPLYLIVDSDVFGTRSLRVKIKQGQNLSNSNIYNNTITLSSTSYTPSNYLIFTGETLPISVNNTYWMWTQTGFVKTPDKYNDNEQYSSSFVMPSTVNNNSYIIISLLGTSVNNLNVNDIVLYINNSGTSTNIYTYQSIAQTNTSFQLQFKIDNALDTVFTPEQNLDFIFALSSNINTSNPITNFSMVISFYDSNPNQIELYKLNSVNINAGSTYSFMNTNSNGTCWLYSGTFNYLPNGYNNLSLPSSYTIPANYQFKGLACMTLTFNGFTEGILNSNDFILKINISGTNNTLISLNNPSVDTVNFRIIFNITPNDNVINNPLFIANQQLDFILCIYTTYNTFRYTQLNVDFRYIDNSYYTGSLVYLEQTSYYTITFQDVTGDSNQNGYINFNGYISVPQNNVTTSLVSANFNGFCPSLRISSINMINNNVIDTWDNFNSTDYTQSQPVSTSYEQYVNFNSNFTGNISDITLNLMVFNSNATFPRNRTLQIRFYDNTPTLLGTTTVSIPYTLSINNSSTRYDINIPLSSPIAVVNTNSYSFSVKDITGDSNSNGYIFIYGSDVNYNFNVDFDIFPRFFFNKTTPSSIVLNISASSPLNPFDTIPIANEVGFQFSFTKNIGVINPFLIALSSFSSLTSANVDYVDVPNNSQRIIRIKYRLGAGVSGTILYEKDYIVNNFLEPYIVSIFLSNFSLQLTAGQIYTLTLQDVTPTGNTLGRTLFYGINSGTPYISVNTGIYPLLYLSQVFYYVNISPPMPLTGFLNNGNDLISFNSLIRENSRPFNYRGLPYTEIKYYEVRLKYLIMPNQILKVCNGGYLNNYPYFYVEIFNDGDRTTSNIMFSNNTNPNVIFKVYITKTYYDQPTSFFVLKTYDESEQRQIFAYRPDKDTRIRILMPDGQTVVQYAESDKLSPFYPNPLLQTNILLSLRPVNNFNPFVKNNFVEIE